LTAPSEARGINWSAWRLAALLALPAFVPLFAHYVGFTHKGFWPTGFLIYDTPYYMANAREHFDSGRFTLFYASPFSYDYGSPRIYFQPLTLLLGVLSTPFRADPGIVFGLVGVITALFCSRAAIALFDVFGDRSRAGGRLSLVAFYWGGGLFVIMATFFAFLPGIRHPAPSGFSLTAWWWFVRSADPADGWWFLNFGRNLVLPTEALYHALFLACVLLIVARRFVLALLTMAILSASHPFTGLQLLAIVTAWAWVELVVLRSRVVPWWFAVGAAVLLMGHILYYLVFLSRFPEHRQLQEQWTLRWTLTDVQTVIAYGLVGGFAVARLRSVTRARQALAQWPNRLLVVWVLVSLMLENHELFLGRAIQPVHFTRGYTWIALFLLGLPVLIDTFERLSRRRTAVAAAAGVGALLAVMLVDNAVWLGAQTTQAIGLQLGRGLRSDSLSLGFGLTADERELFSWMNTAPNRRTVVLSEDETVGYLLTVYTPLRSWRSHYANTPWNRQRLAELRGFFRDGAVVDQWRRVPMLLVFRDSVTWRERTKELAPARVNEVFHNRSFTAVRMSPAPDVAANPTDGESRESTAANALPSAPTTPVGRLRSPAARP